MSSNIPCAAVVAPLDLVDGDEVLLVGAALVEGPSPDRDPLADLPLHNLRSLRSVNSDHILDLFMYK